MATLLAPARAWAGARSACAWPTAQHPALAALRAELRDRGIAVLGAYPGGIDTEMLAGVEAEKAPPRMVATRIIAALAAGETVVFPDDASAGAGAVYRQDPLKLEQMLLGG
jgi:NAD(P)-dependent dehydrogenase (short-subunit alcohol dehydrogenase family)